MPSPYRESDSAPPAPLEELAWRRKRTTAAGWLEVSLFAGLGLLVATGPLPAGFATVGAVAWFVLGAASVVATWKLTALLRASCADWRGWVLRGGMMAYFAVLGVLQLGIRLDVLGYICSALLVAAAVTYIRSFPSSPAPRKDRSLSRVLTVASATVGAVSAPYYLPLLGPAWRIVGVLALLVTAAFFDGLRRSFLVVRHHWWFDSEMEPPGEWVALLVHRDKHAEVLCADETLGWFVSKAEATEWLEDNGYVPAERAIEERLVSEVPPDVLKPRARKKLRSASMSPQPRVRVAPEPSGGAAHEAADAASDEMDDNAPPDEPEQPRAVAVHDPRDPRA